MFLPKKILFPVDIENPSRLLILQVLRGAAEARAALVILFVNSPSAGYRSATVGVDEVALKIQELMGDELDLLNQVSPEYQVGPSPLGKTVSKVYEEVGADLIVVGHRQHHHFLASLIESPEEEIVEWSHSPVLILPDS